MNPSTRNQLMLIRNACRRLVVESPQSAEERGMIVDALSRLVAETAVGVEESPAAAEPASARDRLVTHRGSGEEAKKAVASRFGHSSHSKTSSADFLRMLKADHDHWENLEKIILAEVAAGNSATPAQASSTTDAISAIALTQFLRATFEDEPTVSVFKSRIASDGYSKKTVLVSLTGNRSLPSEIVIRMDKPFNYLGTRVEDEYDALRLLYRNGAPIAEPLALERTGKILGHPFLLLSRLNGKVIGRVYFPPPRNDALTASIAQALARIHAVPIDGLTALGAPLADTRPFIEQELERYHKNWLATGMDCVTVDLAFAWVREHLSDSEGAQSIVHNDFDYHNIMVDEDRVTGILDWEFVHIGNPTADIGYFYTSAEKTGGIDVFLDFYERAGGRRPSRRELDFYAIWGNLRLAVIGFQTEAGYRGGQFDDIRYAFAGVHFLRKPLLAVGDYLLRLMQQSRG